MWAYCRELCGPAACDRAVAATLKTLESGPDTIGADELLLITRTAAAQFAVAGMKGSGENLSAQVDPTCAKTPARLAAWVSHGLRPSEQRDLGEHLDACLLCQAIRIKMDRAERAFAAVSASTVVPEPPAPAESSVPAELSSGRATAAVRAYCRELCGPIGAARALAESVSAAGIGVTSAIVGEYELLRLTRVVAAEQALIDADGRLDHSDPSARRDVVCATTPVRLAAAANGELELFQELELDMHVEECLLCQASAIKMDRAERAFATMVTGALGVAPEYVKRGESVAASDRPSAAASERPRETARAEPQTARAEPPQTAGAEPPRRAAPLPPPSHRQVRARRLVAVLAALIVGAGVAAAVLALGGAFSPTSAPVTVPAAAKSVAPAIPVAAAPSAPVTSPAVKANPARHHARVAPHRAVKAHRPATTKRRTTTTRHKAAPAAVTPPASSPASRPAAPSRPARTPVAPKPSTPSVTPQGTNLPAQSAPTQGIGSSGG